MGDGFDACCSAFTKLNIVVLLPALAGLLARPDFGLWVADWGVSWVEPKDRFLLLFGLVLVSCSAFLDLAMGKASPRNFPLLATPTPQVKVVL